MLFLRSLLLLVVRVLCVLAVDDESIRRVNAPAPSSAPRRRQPVAAPGPLAVLRPQGIPPLSNAQVLAVVNAGVGYLEAYAQLVRQYPCRPDCSEPFEDCRNDPEIAYPGERRCTNCLARKIPCPYDFRAGGDGDNIRANLLVYQGVGPGLGYALTTWDAMHDEGEGEGDEEEQDDSSGGDCRIPAVKKCKKSKPRAGKKRKAPKEPEPSFVPPKSKKPPRGGSGGRSSRQGFSARNPISVG